MCVFLKLNIKGTYPDDIIVCLGLFMSSFHWNERTFICHRCGFCDCVVAFIGSIWCLHMQRSPIVNFIDERSWIECARVAWIAIVTMWWLTRTWPIQGCVKEGKTDGEFHCKHEQCKISVQTNTQQLFFQFIYIYILLLHTFRVIEWVNCISLTGMVCLDCQYACFVHSNRYRLDAAIPSLHAISAVATVTMFDQTI